MEEPPADDYFDQPPNPGETMRTPRIVCTVCRQVTDHLSYCGHCGTLLPSAVSAPQDDSLENERDLRVTLADQSSRAWRLPPDLVTALRGLDASRSAIAGGLALVLVALLADQPGIAVALATLVAPAITLIHLSRLDLYEEEPWRVLLLVGAVGAVSGAIVSVLNVLLIDQMWLDRTLLNTGAAGFVGSFAPIGGGPPAGLLLLAGALTPLLGLVAQLAVPVWLRRWSLHRNEVMDGVVLGAAAGGGFATGGAIVYVWPLIVGSNPGGGVSNWTAALIALVLIQPLAFVLTTALAAAALWHYALTQRSRDLAIPLVGGLLGAIGGSSGGLLLAPYGAVIELLWHALVLLGLILVTRSVLHRALNQDRRAVETGGRRQVCPNCRRLTPPGVFCSRCGHSLTSSP